MINIVEDVENLKPSNISGEIVKWCNPFEKQQFLKKLNINLL